MDTGRAGGHKRWNQEGVNSDRPPIGPLYHPIGVSTEAEAESDADAEERAFSADGSLVKEMAVCAESAEGVTAFATGQV